MTSDKAGRIPDYLEHIISAIGQIEKYSLGLNQTNFMENDMAQDAIIRQFEVIGEAARRIISTDPEFIKKYPALELEGAYRMRNALAHGYDTVNLQTVWDTIEQKLPVLKAEAMSVLASIFPQQ
jgi:uncharacterized protein with HEPN domain